MLFGAFFVMQLLVGVILDNFNKKDEETTNDGGGGAGTESTMMTEEQEAWAKTQEFILSKIMEYRVQNIPAPSDAWGKWCHKVVRMKHFDNAIMGAVMVNTLFMATESFGQPDWWRLTVVVMNYLFAAIFTVECVLKLSGMRWAYFYSIVHGQKYWDSWNCFDFVVVIGTLVGIVLTEIVGGSGGAAAMAIRAFRVGRVLRIVNGAKSLRRLFNRCCSRCPA